MGCCQSSSRRSSSPVYPSPAVDASSQHINSTSPPRSSSVTNNTPRASHSRRSPSGQPTQPSVPASGAPNTPLQVISAESRSHTPHREPWTFSRWRRERTEYFDTRTSGRPETWILVRVVTELIIEGNTGEAQTMLNAAGCTSPTGEIWRGIYDEFGGYYPVPDWVVIRPEELVEDAHEELKSDDEGAGEEGDVEESGQGLADRRDEKGKGKVIDAEENEEGKRIKIRARLSDRGTDVSVRISKEDKVSVLVKRVKEAAQLSQHSRVKIGYMGKILHNDQTLTSQGWNESHVVNALVFTAD